MEKIIVNGLSTPEVDNPYTELAVIKLRQFQRTFLDIIENENQKTDLIFLSAPTGAGKTLCFEYLCKKKPTLLIYPTVALMDDQEKQLTSNNSGLKVFKLNAAALGEIRGYERAEKLKVDFQRYEIIITNPDILSAIVHTLYYNPQDDLYRIFISNYFHYIIYDEFHSYSELELSDIIIQMLLLLGNTSISINSPTKIIFSSATPLLEIIDILREIKPTINIKIVTEKGSNNGSLIRYKTHVCFIKEQFNDYAAQIIKFCKEKNYKTLVMCNSNKFARELYNQLIEEGYEKYITKDTGDETHSLVKADFSKLIIISTAGKSEIGLNYTLDAIIMDKSYNLSSFIQRFGRVSRKKDGHAYIFENTPYQLDKQINYNQFLENLKDTLFEKKLSKRKLKHLIEFKAYLVLDKKIDKRSRDYNILKIIFQNIKYNKFFQLFSNLKSSSIELKNKPVINYDFDDLYEFLQDYKKGLYLLRGITLSTKIRYLRGLDYVFTTYNLLHTLNNYEIEKNDGYLTLKDVSDKGLIHSISYKGVSYRYYDFRDQIKNHYMKVCKKMFEFKLIIEKDFTTIKYLLNNDLERILIPDSVQLTDNRIINIKKDVKYIFDDKIGNEKDISL